MAMERIYIPREIYCRRMFEAMNIGNKLSRFELVRKSLKEFTYDRHKGLGTYVSYKTVSCRFF